MVLANLSTQAEKQEAFLADRYHRRLVVGVGPKDRRFATPDFEEQAEVEKQQRGEERKRLLYVAATRAMEKLKKALIARDASFGEPVLGNA